MLLNMNMIIVISSIVSAIATVVIAFYAVLSHRLAKANLALSEAIHGASQRSDARHVEALHHVAAATLAGGAIGGQINDGVSWFRRYLAEIQATERDAVN